MATSLSRLEIGLMVMAFIAACPNAHGATAGTGQFGAGAKAEEARIYRGTYMIEFWETKIEGVKKGVSRCGRGKTLDAEIQFHPDGTITGSAEKMETNLYFEPSGEISAPCEHIYPPGSNEISGSYKPDGSFQFTHTDDTFEGRLTEKELNIAKEFKKTELVVFLNKKASAKYKLVFKMKRVSID